MQLFFQLLCPERLPGTRHFGRFGHLAQHHCRPLQGGGGIEKTMVSLG